jgi:hypothetical protein
VHFLIVQGEEINSGFSSESSVHETLFRLKKNKMKKMEQYKTHP